MSHGMSGRLCLGDYAWEIMSGRFLAKMDVKMMISLNLITVEEVLATIDGAFTLSVDVLHPPWRSIIEQ